MPREPVALAASWSRGSMFLPRWRSRFISAWLFVSSASIRSTARSFGSSCCVMEMVRITSGIPISRGERKSGPTGVVGQETTAAVAWNHCVVEPAARVATCAPWRTSTLRGKAWACWISVSQMA